MIIGIPHYNDFEGLKNCLTTMTNSTKVSDCTLIIINSDDKEKDNIQELLKQFYSNFIIEIINTPKLGPLDAYNRLFEIAKDRKEDLFLTQTDVNFMKCKKDWLAEMQWIAKKHPESGLITCWAGGGVSGADFIEGFQWVGAWCTYIPYRTIEKLGGYDTNLPLGWGVDIDYTYAVVQAGLKIVIVDYWVEHIPNYKEKHEHEKVKNIEELKKEAFRYLREKWRIGEYKP